MTNWFLRTLELYKECPDNVEAQLWYSLIEAHLEQSGVLDNAPMEPLGERT